MRARLPWIFGLAVVVAIVAATATIAWIVGGDDAGPGPDNTAASSVVSPAGTSVPAPASPTEQAQAAAERAAFWNRERLAEAFANPAPRPAPEDTGEGRPAPSAPSPNAPGDEPRARADATEPTGWTPPATTDPPDACQSPAVARPQPGFENERTSHPASLTDLPARVTGVLIAWDDVNFNNVEDEGDRQSACSATIVTARNQSVLVTAAHCVVRPKSDQEPQGRWLKSFGFLPSFRVGEYYRVRNSDEETLRRFVENEVWWGLQVGNEGDEAAFALTRWIDSTDFSHDFAAIVMAPRTIDGARKRIQQALGSLGWDMAGSSEVGPVRLLGYPADPPFDGRSLFECRGASKAMAFDGDRDVELKVGCDMTSGSSGGPWLAGTDPIGQGRIVSVNSWGLETNEMVGPLLSGPHLTVLTTAEAIDTGR